MRVVDGEDSNSIERKSFNVDRSVLCQRKAFPGGLPKLAGP